MKPPSDSRVTIPWVRLPLGAEHPPRRESHTTAYQSASSQTAAAVAPARVERRLHPRVAIDCPVCLCWRDRQGDHVLRAQARDVSKFGMLVEADKAIAPGVVVSVETNSARLGGACVRHCTPAGLKYRIGLHAPDRMTTLMIGPRAL